MVYPTSYKSWNSDPTASNSVAGCSSLILGSEVSMDRKANPFGTFTKKGCEFYRGLLLA